MRPAAEIPRTIVGRRSEWQRPNGLLNRGAPLTTQIEREFVWVSPTSIMAFSSSGHPPWAPPPMLGGERADSVPMEDVAPEMAPKPIMSPPMLGSAPGAPPPMLGGARAHPVPMDDVVLSSDAEAAPKPITEGILGFAPGAPPPMLGGERAHPVPMDDVLLSGDAETAPKRMKLGFNLLQKAGYKGVGGLGRQESGIDNPVEVIFAPPTVGLGYAAFEEEMNQEHEGDIANLVSAEKLGNEKREMNVVVVRIIPRNCTNEEVLQMAETWGPVRRFAIDRHRNGYMQLMGERKVKRMIEHYRKEQMKIRGSLMTCLAASEEVFDSLKEISLLKQQPVVFAENPASQLPPPPGQDGMSLLLQSLGASNQSLQISEEKKQSTEFDYDDYDADETNNSLSKPVNASPAVFSSLLFSLANGAFGAPASTPTTTTTKSDSMPPPLPSAATTASLLSSLEALQKKKIRKGRILENFKVSHESELECNEDDEVELLSDDQNGWTEARLISSGLVGYIPTDFFEELK